MTTLDIAQIGFLVVVVALGVGLIIYTLAKKRLSLSPFFKKKSGDIIPFSF